jgi:hypothetical protein
MGEWRYSSITLVSGTHWRGGLVGPRAGLHAVEKNFLALPEIETRPLSL